MNKAIDKNYQKFREQQSLEEWDNFFSTAALLEKKPQIIERWVNYFFQILNRFIVKQKELKIFGFYCERISMSNGKKEIFYLTNPFFIFKLMEGTFPIQILDDKIIIELYKKHPNDEEIIKWHQRHLDKKYIIFHPHPAMIEMR